jgi:copper chaperone CopZ
VQAVHIDLHSHRVDVDYDPRRLEVEDILGTVGGAGVTASVISEDR